MRHTLFALFLVACGGSIVTSSDGGADGGACGPFAASCPVGSNPVCVSGQWKCVAQDIDGGSSCATLAVQVSAARGQVQACCPTCKSLQCQKVVQDLCCPITVQGDPTLLAQLVDQDRKQCAVACPAMPCPPLSKTCKQLGSDPNTGVCQ